MRRLTTLTFAAALTVASIGCETATNTTVNKTLNNANSNGNVAVIVNNNSTVVANKPVNMTREEYEKDRVKYEADKGTSTIGQGVNDSYIWFKTKGALATTEGSLRDSTINVDVNNDIITLKGTVATADQKEMAEKVAKGIEGQKGVKNELKVQAGDSMGNQMVNGNSNTAKMQSANTNQK